MALSIGKAGFPDIFEKTDKKITYLELIFIN